MTAATNTTTPRTITLEVLLELDLTLRAARCPEDVFGTLSGGDAGTALFRVYGSLSRTCHPDLAAPDAVGLAAEVFGRLAQWKRRAEAKLRAGTYGDRAAEAYAPITLTLRGQDLMLTRLLAEGTLASLHVAQFEGHPEGVWVKIARDPADNDLLERETVALRRMQEADSRPEMERFLTEQRMYVPRVLDAFLVEGETPGAQHRATALWAPEGRRFTAEGLRRDKFPSGVESKHVWWIFRRLLLTLWMAHQKGIVHGAVTPDHLLVYPEQHGIVLIDWAFSVDTAFGARVPAVDPAWEVFVAPEVLRREPATPATDIYSAAATTVYLLNGDVAAKRTPDRVPAPIANLLYACLSDDPRHRPQDAERLHNDFGRVLEQCFGTRRYAEFIVP